MALLNFGVPMGGPDDPGWYGNGSLWTQFDPDHGFAARYETDRDPQTGLLRVKLPWFRAEPGQVHVSGRLLGGGSGTFTADVRTVGEYGPTGFVPSELLFGQPGCWEITAALNQSRLVVLMEVRLLTHPPPSPPSTYCPACPTGSPGS